MLGEPAVGSGPRPSIGHLRPRRGPRSEEIAVMRLLATGPKPMTSGPIGRCVKRGWCRPVMVDAVEGTGRGPQVLFALTDAGRALIGGA